MSDVEVSTPVESRTEVQMSQVSSENQSPSSEKTVVSVPGDIESPNTSSSETDPSLKREKWIVLLNAVLGELTGTTLFLFSVEIIAYHASSYSADAGALIGTLGTTFLSIALIYSFADVSGAHFNPAVTIGTMVGRKTSLVKGTLYIIAQLIAAIVSSCLILIAYPDLNTFDHIKVTVNSDNVQYYNAFFMEVALTFILVYVIFSTAFVTIDTKFDIVLRDDSNLTVQKKKIGRYLTIYTTTGKNKAGFAPIAIGFTLGFLGLIGGNVSGGAFNPARVFGPAIFSKTWANHELYWIADGFGAILAAFAHSFFDVHAKERAKLAKMRPLKEILKETH